MPPYAIVLIVLGAIILLIFLCSIRVVPQAHEYIVEFLGKYRRTLLAGPHILVPFMERVSKINYYLDIAQTTSERSTCLRRRYGAIIVKNDVIVSTGYMVTQ